MSLSDIFAGRLISLCALVEDVLILLQWNNHSQMSEQGKSVKTQVEYW